MKNNGQAKAPAYTEPMSSDTDHGWRPPKQIGANVCLRPLEAETADLGIGEHQISLDPETGLATAREIQLPLAVVMSIGERAAELCPALDVGDVVIWQRRIDDDTEFVYNGERINIVNVETRCPQCKSTLRDDVILGVQQ